MSHVKASGKVAQQSQRMRHGRRFGLKKSDGQSIATGQIIIRQKGAVYKPGNGVGMGHDYTLFALKPGLVKFGKRFGKTLVKVVPTA
jgi:large subunit ribosomal protein L27